VARFMTHRVGRSKEGRPLHFAAFLSFLDFRTQLIIFKLTERPRPK